MRNAPTDPSSEYDPREASGKSEDLNQLESIVSQLDKEITDYLQLGVSSELRLTPKQLLEVVGWAKQVNQGEEVTPVEKEPIDYFKTGLLEEIIQIPSNIFEEVEFPDGKTRYMPVRPEVWLAGLVQYEEKVLKLLASKGVSHEEALDERFLS